MKKNDDKIDFVVLWVDPSDKEWQKSRAKYAKEINSEHVDDREERYRDWGLFKYWFRGVEKFAPWVNKVHLVTCGHVPEWLNTDHPKLNIVKHSDFMPKEALPTFNSNAIEVCVHRISGLAEQFVLFNDDMFVIDKVKPSDFFRNGNPVNTMALFALMPNADSRFHALVANDLAVVNRHFDFNNSKKRDILKYLSLKQREWILFTYPLLIYNQFMGFRNFHISVSYLKQTFAEVWEKEPGLLENTVKTRFRSNDTDVSNWLMNYWQFASGNFCQHDAHFGRSLPINGEKVKRTIEKQKCRILCVNDVGDVGDFGAIRSGIVDGFEKILPEKSEFEK